nr:uncharacterized protein LOC109169837 [Ipomoea batatas]
MATERIQMIIAKELEGQKAKLALEEHNSTAKKNNSFNPEDLWLNKKGCPIGSVPIPKCRSKEQLQIVRNVGRAQYTSQKLDNHSYDGAPSHLDFAGLLVGNAPSGRFTGARAIMTIWNPSLQGKNQYSSASLYLEDGDNQIRVGWIVHPALYGDSRTRLFSRWTSDNYGKTGCYINHCPGFVITSNVVPLNYAFPQISVSRGEQFDVTLGVSKSSTGNWEFYYNDQKLGTWPSFIFSKMGESASQLRFGGECYEPENQGVSPQMGSGDKFKNGQYDRTAYMRQLRYSDSRDGDFDVNDAMVQVQMSRCYYAASQGYNSHDDWYRYSFMYGGMGGQDGARCFDL